MYERRTITIEPSDSEPVDRGERIRVNGREARRSARAARDDVLAIVEDLHALLRERMAKHPYLTMGVAFGTGYVLAGGVPKPLLRLAFAAGVRMAVDRILQPSSPAREENDPWPSNT